MGIHVGDGPKREFCIETMLLFRHHLAPKIITAFSDALMWVARKFGAEALFKYMDDFVSHPWPALSCGSGGQARQKFPASDGRGEADSAGDG